MEFYKFQLVEQFNREKAEILRLRFLFCLYINKNNFRVAHKVAHKKTEDAFTSPEKCVFIS